MEKKINFWDRFNASFLSNKKITILLKLLSCILFSFYLITLNYKWSNNSISGGKEEKLVTNIRLQLNKLGLYKQKQDLLDGIILINISNDKDLIDNYDNFGIPKGNIDITDRNKIALFLEKTNNKHKYILLDINFDPIHISKNDSLLSESFKRTKNIIIPSIYKNDIISKPLFNIKHGVSNYKKTIFSNRFLKYDFLKNDSIKSISLKIAEELYGNNLKKNGSYYFDNDSLCLNSVILNYRIKPILKYNENGIQNYYDLGVDILDSKSDKEIKNFIENKIVLIGDFEDRDLHETAYGKIAGVLINYNAILYLKEKKHLIPNSLIIFLYIIYLSITMTIIYNYKFKFTNKIKNKIKSYNTVKKITHLANKLKFKSIIVFLIGDYLKMGFLFLILNITIFIVYEIHIDILGSTLTFGTLIFFKNLFYDLKVNKKTE